MINKILLFVSVAALMISCVNDIRHDCINKTLVGSWSYITPFDSTYNEVYFTTEFFIENLSSIGIYGVREYSLSNDTVYMMPEHEFIFKIIEIDMNKIEIVDNRNQRLTLRKVNVPKELYRSFCLSPGRVADLQNGRQIRSALVLKDKVFLDSASVGSDSILFVPEPEH